MSDRIVVVGASIAGIRSAQALRSSGFDGELTVVGAEKELPYDKPPLSKQLLTGDWDVERTRLISWDEAADAGISLKLGVAAGHLDGRERRLELTDGSRLSYDHLIVATGVRPRTLSTSPGDSPVSTVRELDDARSLQHKLSNRQGRVVVVGGGFIGAEVAASAASLGLPATIIEYSSTPFARVLGEEVGALVERLHHENGVEVIAGAEVREVRHHPGGGSVVRLADGREIPAAIVVAGIGCVPNTEWLAGTGLSVDDGIVTDEFCRVPGPGGVHAIGDVARWRDIREGGHRRTEHWTHAFQQAQQVAHNIVNPDDLRPQVKAPYFWSDQHGVKIQMTGHRTAGDEVEVMTIATPGGPRAAALYSRGSRFTAAVTFAWPQIVPKLRRAWEERATVTEARAIIDPPNPA